MTELTHRLRDRILRLLRSRGLWPEPGEEDAAAQPEYDSLLPFLSAASIQGQVALGAEAGRRVGRLGHPSATDTSPTAPGELCSAVDGFSLHAQVRVEADDRERLEHLCRYVARPALAAERLSFDDQGRVLLELRHAWRDGTTHIVFEPLVFLERLASLVPHPREHQLTYHGVLAPASSWRDLVVPASSYESASVEPPVATAASSSSPGSAADLLATACPEPPLPIPSASVPSDYSTSYSWAELLRRVFSVDVLTCPTCGSHRRLIALISDPPVVRKILRHLGLPTEPPALAPPRSPPQMAFGF